jgi:hypothetical protein
MGEHAGGGEAQDQRQHEGEGRREQQPLSNDLHRGQRVLERGLEEDDRVGMNRHCHLGVVRAGERDAILLDAPRDERSQRDSISCDVPRARRPGVRLDRERRLVPREDGERDDPGIGLDLKALDLVLPDDRVLRELPCERHADLGQLLESGVHEPPFERRHHDHVRGAERAGHDPDEDDDHAGPDSARERHAAYSERKR